MNVSKFDELEGISQKTINNYKSSAKRINSLLGKSTLRNIIKVKGIIETLSVKLDSNKKPTASFNRQGILYSAVIRYLTLLDNTEL